MTKLHFGPADNPHGFYNINLLHQELVRIPALAPVMRPDGRIYAVFVLESRDNEIWLTVEDDAPTDVIRAVVAAHDPTISAVPVLSPLDVLGQRLDDIDRRLKAKKI